MTEEGSGISRDPAGCVHRFTHRQFPLCEIGERSSGDDWARHSVGDWHHELVVLGDLISSYGKTVSIQPKEEEHCQGERRISTDYTDYTD